MFFSIKLSPVYQTGSSCTDGKQLLLRDRSRVIKAQCCFERCVVEEVAGGLGNSTSLDFRRHKLLDPVNDVEPCRTTITKILKHNCLEFTELISSNNTVLVPHKRHEFLARAQNPSRSLCTVQLLPLLTAQSVYYSSWHPAI